MASKGKKKELDIDGMMASMGTMLDDDGGGEGDNGVNMGAGMEEEPMTAADHAAVNSIVKQALEMGKKETENEEKKKRLIEARKQLNKGMNDIKKAILNDNHNKYALALQFFTSGIEELSNALSNGIFDTSDDGKMKMSQALKQQNETRKENLIEGIVNYLDRVEEIEIKLKTEADYLPGSKKSYDGEGHEEIKKFKALRPKVCVELTKAGYATIAKGTSKRKEGLELVKDLNESSESLSDEEKSAKKIEANANLHSGIDWMMGHLKAHPETKGDSKYTLVEKAVSSMLTEMENLAKA